MDSQRRNLALRYQFSMSKVRRFHRGGGLRVVGQYKANELYTTTELKRRGDCLYMPYMEVVNIPKNKTFFSFGARFEIQD